MIEINLLPHEMRKPEGTPLPRLLSIIVGIVLAVVGGLFISNYYFVEIPATQQKIDEMNRRMTAAAEGEQQVLKIQTEIDVIKGKVKALRNLQNSRVRWARLLDRFRKAVPEGCVIRTFSVSSAAAGFTEQASYKIQFTGYTSGETDQQSSLKLNDLINRLEEQFEVDSSAAEVAPIDQPVVELKPGELPKGYSEFLRLKFEKPTTGTYSFVPLPAVKLPPKEAKNYTAPKSGLSFTMSVTFTLPPQEQGM